MKKFNPKMLVAQYNNALVTKNNNKFLVFDADENFLQEFNTFDEADDFAYKL